METNPRKSYPSDVSDEEWAFAAPYLTLMRDDAPQRAHDLREIFNALRWLLRAGAPWRLLPNDFPPWAAVYQQAQRWTRAGVFEAMVHDLRELIRLGEGRDEWPTAVVLDSSTLQSTPESGARAGYDGYKRKKGSKLHLAVDTLGHLLALRVTPADTQDCACYQSWSYVEVRRLPSGSAPGLCHRSLSRWAAPAGSPCHPSAQRPVTSRVSGLWERFQRCGRSPICAGFVSADVRACERPRSNPGAFALPPRGPLTRGAGS